MYCIQYLGASLNCVCSVKTAIPINCCLCFVVLSYNAIISCSCSDSIDLFVVLDSFQLILITVRSDLLPHFDSWSLFSTRIFILSDWSQRLCHSLPLLTVGLLIVFTLWIELVLFAERLSLEILTSTFQSFYQYDFTSKWSEAFLNARFLLYPVTLNDSSFTNESCNAEAKSGMCDLHLSGLFLRVIRVSQGILGYTNRPVGFLFIYVDKIKQ